MLHMILLLVCACVVLTASEIPTTKTLTSKPVFRIFHAFDPDNPEVFVPRGSVTIDSLLQGVGSLEQSRLSESDYRKLRNAAETNQLYQIKVVDPSSTSGYVSSFTKACLMYESGLSDVLTVSLDMNGNLIGASMTFPGFTCGTNANTQAASIRTVFNTTLKINVNIAGPQPDTATYIQRMERERLDKQRGEGADNRSFFAKYWMYIVPVLIFVLISGASNPEGGAGAQR